MNGDNSIVHSLRKMIGSKSRLLLGIGAFLVLIILISRLSSGNIASSQILTTNGGQINIAPARATFAVNREFRFPIKNDKGERIGNVLYAIDTAELRDEIIVKGQKATAVEGKVFLILNLKIKNELSQTVQISTKDYVRLSVDNGGNWLAPDLHNDPVDVQAISTKLTRVCFPINDGDIKNLQLAVGEINGSKTTIDLTFQ